MKRLPETKRKNGYTYRLIERGKKTAIYYQVEADAYEVFLIKERPESEFKGKIIPASEIFPPDEAFGKWAWTFRKKDRAQHRFNELEQGLTRKDFTDAFTGKKVYWWED